MPLTRLDNLLSSKTGKYLYVSPDDFNASDALDNRGNSPTRPFVTIQRAFLETARYSYVPGSDNDRFDQFTILLAPGTHYVDNRPGDANASTISAFNYANGEWTDNSILDLSNPNNILRKFNSVEGGAIIPRGTSLVGTDLRRTQVRPLYVPDPADKDIGRTSIFQVTGGCYFWQFTILDGDLTPNNPLYDSTAGVGKVYSQPDGTVLSIPEYSHHKITNFVFARKEDLGALYQKVAKAFSNYQPTIDDPGEFAFKIQENRIVGPLSDSITIESIIPTNITSGPFSGTCDITVTTKINHGFFTGQYVAITGLNAGQDKLNGVFKVKTISGTNLKEFTYNVPYSAAGLGLTSGATYTESSLIKLSKTGTTASVQAEVDSVESASPYVFNVSIRSTWGICGIWADGSRATGFKSMVIAQYTGVSLQKDDRAFIRYDEFTNTWNQANLQDAFSTTPYHIDGTAYWKDDWRNFHVRASEDAFIQCVSIFAVGFADHFLMESGGDMSITNSNSNFGNTSLHTVGYKGFAFNQDKGGYITHIIPPKKLIDSTPDLKNYYTLNVPLSNESSNNTKLYYGIDNASDPTDRPAASIEGFKLGAKAGEKLYVKLDAIAGESGKQIKSALVTPNGVKKWSASLSTLSPTGLFSADDNKLQDAANLIDSNKAFIQAEAFGYILEKYPALQNISYVNPNITTETGRYRDASNLIKANRTEIIDSAFADMVAQYPSFTVPGNTAPGNQVGGAGTTKCKRDIGYIVDAIVSDLYNGGNAGIVDATKAYFDGAGVPISNGLVGETAQSVFAFNKARDYMKSALTNQLTVKDLTITADPVTGSNTSPNSCANVRGTVDNLISIITSAVSSGSISSLPVRDLGAWSSVAETSKCKRDIGYIVEAVTSDLRLGGNVNVVNAAESYYVGTTLDYINNEKTETLDAYNYVRDLCISAMRNWSFTIQNATIANGSPTVTVASTVGIVMGMSVTGTGIPAGAYVKKILNSTTFQLGTVDSFLDTGATVNATASSSTVTLTLSLTSGIWADTSNIQPVTDSSVIVDTNYPECANVATAITTAFTTISTIINSGVGTVPVSSPSLNTSALANRATLFKLTEIATSNTNPHDLETGTPVRLVPRALNDSVDKRLIRLPKGFDTNTKYYVIAPGRNTEPFDFSSYTSFDGSTTSQQALMLATSEENANAGIYIYSSETESIDPNVVIEVHQYVQDLNYDLFKYKANLLPGSNEVFITTGPHSFDKQAANTTPQRVFFRTGVDIAGSSLPTRSSTSGGGTLPTNIEYYVRYVPPVSSTEERNTRFTIHTSHIDAINGNNAVQFDAAGTEFYVFSNKRRTPVRFDAEASTQDTLGNKGSWYIQTSATNNEILDRLKLSVYADITGKSRTTDTWFYRVADDRDNSDKVYRLRYVIPKEGNYRDPINGFVLKLKTDETRRLLPQKIVLKPVGAADSFANVVKNGERLGLTTTEQKNGSAYNAPNPNFVSQYDPYTDPYIAETDSKISFAIQSAKKINVEGSNYLQLTVFDVGVIDPALKTSLFSSVKVSSPQGGTGNFVVNSTITWTGANTGSATVHAWFPSHNYLILKNIAGSLDYSAFSSTTFTQGSVTAVMQEEKDGGRSNKKNFLYTVDGANVYTLTPGDTITLPSTSGGNAQYRVDSVSDVDDLQNTYYIYKSETIRKRIKGQQDGIYYLTAIRGDIRPYPVGSGIGENFRNFKFSQPVSRIYPLSQKNDPLWFQITDSVTNQDNPSRDTTLLDPPATVSSADNYVHGYVTVNDAKRSVTKEAVVDLVADPGTGSHIFTGVNALTAKEGGASAGSEARKIPISGESDFPTEQKLYVELRRPSIARSGNHTFEYLGFGPGNYSTGFPARQQVVLTDKQDFYAQAKREDAGIVLYTGLNSSGDLYIGNRKINAITGEETFLDAPITDEEDEDVGISNVLVTTFDDPVTFNNTVTFNYNNVIPPTLPVVSLNVPILISSDTTNTSGAIIKPPLTIINYSSPAGSDANDPKANGNGDMTLGNNIFTFGVWDMNVRGSQDYKIRTATNNYTPVQISDYGSNSARGAAGFFNTSQQINSTNSNWGTNPPRSGEILFKGEKITYSGSLGWIFANDYETKSTTGASPQVISIRTYNTYSVIRVNFGDTLANLGIRADSQIRITGSSNTAINSPTSWSIPTTNVIIAADANGGTAINEPGYPGATATYLYLYIAPNIGTSTVTQSASSLGLTFQVSNNLWKEFGVIGSESIRTKTSIFGDYKVGINTLARATDTAYQSAYITTETEPRANLDVVGNSFISGKSVAVSINSSGVSTKTESALDNALLVGGDSATPNNAATLRVATTNSGRLGINATNAQLDRALVVVGTGRITGDFKMEADAEINGGDLTSTSSTFNLLNNSSSPTTTLNLGGYVTTANIFNTTTSAQTVNLGTAVTAAGTLNVHTASTNSTVNVGTVGNSNNTYQSLITLGGAFANPSGSIFRVKNYQNIFDGNLQINGGETVVVNGVSRTRATINSSANLVNMFTESGAVSTLKFGTFATDLTLGGVAGTTTIQNNLIVKAASQSFSSLTMNGGYLSASATVSRGALGSTASVHANGTSQILNVDYYRFVPDIDGALNVTSVSGNTFNVISNTQYFQNNQIVCFPVVSGTTGITQTSYDSNGDPSGPFYYVVNATANNFQVSLTNGGPAVTLGGTFVQVTATLRYTTVYSDGFSSWNATSTNLPINNPKGIGTNEYLLIDNEIVKTTNFPTSTAPYTVPVIRGVDGTTAAVHVSDSVIYKLEKTPTASYLTPNYIPASTITKTGTSQISINANTNQFTTTGTDLINTYVVQFSNLGGLTGINTTTKYFVVNLSSTGSTQTFQLSPTYPDLTPIDLDGTVTSATSFTIDSTKINLAEFGGSFNVRDYLRIDGTNVAGTGTSEFVRITATPTGDTKKFSINNGAPAPVVVFSVDSITGDTSIAGNTTLGKSLTINGSTVCGTELFTITDGSTSPITRFSIDSCDGDTIIGGSTSGGSLTIGDDFTIKNGILNGTTYFSVDAQTGNTVIGNGNSGTLKIEGNAGSTSTSTGALVVDGGAGIAENLYVGGDVTLSGGDLTVNDSSTKRFKVNNTGAIDMGGIDGYFTSSGGRRTLYISSSNTTSNPLISNVNYLISAGADLILYLPTSPQTGDIIRFVDIGGNLTYNRSLIIRAQSNHRVQGDANGTKAGGLTTAYGNGGELIVQTRNAAFGLVYAGSTDSSGAIIPSSSQGWWLMEL